MRALGHLRDLEAELARIADAEPRDDLYAGVVWLVHARIARHHYRPAVPLIEEHGFGRAA